jgi:hypothetical protein
MSSLQNKVRNRVGFINQRTYKEFSQKHPDISYNEYVEVLKASNKAIRDTILNNPLGFKLPYNIGYLAVDKFKGLRDYVAIDWIATRRLGKKIPLTNLHSFGYFFKIKLYPNPRIKPLQVYKMTAHRILKRMLAASIKGGKEYLEIDRSYFSNRFKIGHNLKFY